MMNARPLILLVVWCAVLANARRCHREPPSEVTAALKTPGDNGFRIVIGGDPDRYAPGTVYTVSLLGARTHAKLQTFLRFMLTVEATGSSSLSSGTSRRGRSDPWSPQRAGRFQLFGDSLTAFNEECVNTVREAESSLAKTEIQTMWTAPPTGSGCVVFRAMVLEDENSWFMDDGALSLTLCEQQERRNGDTECCACDEAKYQVFFEGLWSAETHPKDFPTNLWLTHFSDVVGASHEPGFHVWREGVPATDGLRQLAEWGAPRTLETELGRKRHHIRTIVKAAGLWHPRVNANTSSTFRVDRRHPLISMVSMLGPSPDWIVGVSGFNLCLTNCTWMESQTVDLYPYDAGTDSGITYMSPNAPTSPAEPVRRITRTWPATEKAPFYDPSPEAPDIEPLARLYLKREYVVPRSCDYTGPTAEDDSDVLLEATVAENNEDSDRPECQVTIWGEWSLCSVTCGKGLRMRAREYINEPKAQMMGCDRQLIAKEMCAADVPTCPGEDTDDVCGVTEWSPWSECSVMCGEGVTMRTRHFLNRMGFKKCSHVDTVEKEACTGIKGQCMDSGVENEGCHVTMWSEWSPCSASCGEGRRGRSRFFLGPGTMPPKRCQLEQWSPCLLRDCHVSMDSAKEICALELDVGLCRGYFPRWFFNTSTGECDKFVFGGCRGNGNNFDSPERCEEVCGPVKVLLKGMMASNVQRVPHENDAEPIDCMITPWSEWSPCSTTCGPGYRERLRMIKLEGQHGGKPCPRKLSRRKKCNLQPCA